MSVGQLRELCDTYVSIYCGPKIKLVLCAPNVNGKFVPKPGINRKKEIGP